MLPYRRRGARLRISLRVSQGEGTGKQRSRQAGHAGPTSEVKFRAADLGTHWLVRRADGTD